ncbi:hypothetical protein ACFL1R_11635 [Candidatus Latescibacterota bacterium]
MDQNDIFSTEHDTIDINGLDNIVEFARYNPLMSDGFLHGLELAEDLTTKSGILYTEGTLISPQRIARLIQLKESNPGLELFFKIKRSSELIQNFRKDIKEQIGELFKRDQKNKVFSELLSRIGENFEGIMDDILSEENITLAVYKMRFICESMKSKKSVIYFNHSLNVALFSVAIASSEQYDNVVGKDKAKLAEICKVGLFHNYGALTNIDKILKAPEDKMFQMYWDENRNGFYSLGKLQFSFEIMDSIRFLCEYYAGRKEFITKNEWQATMANIVLVVESFLQKGNGLFGLPQGVREVVDQLNVLMMEKEFNELAVKTLTSELNLQDIFDFYQELQSLMVECPYNNSGIPYPITGFKSPTLFICSKHVYECSYIESSLKAVNLIKPIGELQAGKYHRCLLLTPKLISFYKKHYIEIKKK